MGKRDIFRTICVFGLLITTSASAVPFSHMTGTKDPQGGQTNDADMETAFSVAPFPMGTQYVFVEGSDISGLESFGVGCVTFGAQTTAAQPDAERLLVNEPISAGACTRGKAVPVPEPASLAIFATALLSLGVLLTWRRPQ